MLTTYFLGGAIKIQNCKTRFEGTKTKGSQLPKDIDYIISIDTQLRATPEEVKKALSLKGYPKCRVDSSGTIVFYSKTSKPCTKFKCPDLSQVEKDSTSLMGMKKDLDSYLKQKMTDSPGLVRIETTEPIEFKEAAISSKDRIYPSISLAKALKYSKLGKLQFKGKQVLDANNCTSKSIIDVLGEVQEFRQLIEQMKPLVKTCIGWKFITNDATVTFKSNPGIKLDIFPKYGESIVPLVPLIFDCLTELNQIYLEHSEK